MKRSKRLKMELPCGCSLSIESWFFQIGKVQFQHSIMERVVCYCPVHDDFAVAKYESYVVEDIPEAEQTNTTNTVHAP